ncbi:MAG: RAMP superfamily CRISPR-associated protein [Actinomyces sp.]|uniref:RAMP superfamily CRISPR-associated protein n=1 Tax=Pauljensenia sp. UMB3104 TaxID=3046331 RepID=UPI00254FB15E|nr:RAMP superfamily CRISPR-associated protein [Pauljensenia sp. UMB3104]MBS6967796.1 CRISPR-associated protein [Actinomyces sp.]MDK7159896.1 RAMP superfamily CRISPR-associated protein [Pauljensenia sp. UMB3104]MDU5163926.1 RAMP superfamily CRISPR-associated protein [Actinomyces sp.]
MTIYRYDMTIRVRVVSALHSGGVDEVPVRPMTDEDGRTVQPNAFVRNGLGEAILPGRSIKGAIRAAFEEHMNELDFVEEELKSLWGGEMRREVGTRKKQRGGGTEESLPLRASALTFHHAVVWDRTRGELPHRMSTAIDRATGGAADGALFAYEYLPVDTTFEIRVSAEAQDPTPKPPEDEDTESTTPSKETKGTPPAPPELVEKALQAVVELLHGKCISLGGRTGSGWGRIEPLNENARYDKLAVVPSSQSEKGDSTSVLAQILDQHSPVDIKPHRNLDRQSGSTTIKIEWQAPSGLFVGMNKPDGIKPSKEDTVPAAPLRNWHLNDTHRADHGDTTYPTVAHKDKASLLLPGTSIRGTLRSHCSRIARSIVSDSEGCDELTMAEDVHKQLAADPILVRYLFGTTEYRGAVRVHDCEGQIPAQEEKDKPLKLTRNAIDRVTGSAAHGALYSELLYPHATWDSIQIDVDHAQLCRNIRQDPGGFVLPAPSSSAKDYELPGFKIRLQAAILLLTMAITDLCEGVLPLGGGTGGGLGFIDVSHVSFEGLPGKNKSISSQFEEPTNSDDAHEVRKAQATFARSILESILAAFAEDGEEATSAEQRVINLIREWADLGPRDNQGGSLPSHFRPTTVRIGWNSPTGVFVHDPQADKGNTQHPLRAKTAGKNEEDSKDPLLLPGTSIRGALRSRCSRIARTVLYADNPPSQVESFTQADSDGNQVPIDVHEQLAKEPRLVRYMFGTTEYRGAVRVRDCTTKNIGPSIKVTHNAIDRWTGGAVKGLLFEEVIYPHATWNDIVIEVDTARLLQNVKTESGIEGLSLDECLPFARASWCLLCIALAELSAGTLPLGGRTTRGHGQVEVTSLSVSGADGQVVNTPAEATLWKRNDSSEDDARGGATALLAYLRNKTEEQPSYEDWAECLLKPEEPTNGASKPNESDKQ